VKRKLIIILVVIIMISMASLSFAAGEAKGSYTKSDLKAGTTEVSVTYAGAYNSVGLRPFIGYFVTDEIEVGGSFLVESGDYEGNDYTTTALTLLGRYNVPIEQNLVVFGEVGIEQINLDSGSGGVDETTFLMGVGARVFPSKAFSMNFSFDYIIGSFDTPGADVDTDSLRAALGLSVFIF
jgi:hypothetical protein